MKKYIISILLLIWFVCLFPVDAEVKEDVIKNRVSLFLYESMDFQIDLNKPIDHEIVFNFMYNDNIDYYYRQIRGNGVFSREYSLTLQQCLYKNLYIAGFRSDSPYEDVYSVDVKYLIGENWKTFIGISNCWDKKYGIKALLEEKKSFNLDIFIIPTEITIGIKTMTDFKRVYDEEVIRAKFSISLPLSWKLNKYIKTNISLMIKSVDYGNYRCQQNLMLGIDIVK